MSFEALPNPVEEVQESLGNLRRNVEAGIERGQGPIGSTMNAATEGMASMVTEAMALPLRIGVRTIIGGTRMLAGATLRGVVNLASTGVRSLPGIAVEHTSNA